MVFVPPCRFRSSLILRVAHTLPASAVVRRTFVHIRLFIRTLRLYCYTDFNYTIPFRDTTTVYAYAIVSVPHRYAVILHFTIRCVLIILLHFTIFRSHNHTPSC